MKAIEISSSNPPKKARPDGLFLLLLRRQRPPPPQLATERLLPPPHSWAGEGGGEQQDQRGLREGREGWRKPSGNAMDGQSGKSCMFISLFSYKYIYCTWHMHDFPMNVQPSNRGGMPSVLSDGCLRSSSSNNNNNSSNSIPRRLSTECTAT